MDDQRVDPDRDRVRPDGGTEPCDDCGAGVTEALARTVRVTVDRAEVHSHRLCPDCFAAWVDRYEREMRPTSTANEDSEIIVD
jgi:hypothetical protein